MKRCLLHKSKLAGFKSWLTLKQIPCRPGKGAWQILQVQTKHHGWQAVFERIQMPEHVTVNEKLIPLVRAFIRESKDVVQT